MKKNLKIIAPVAAYLLVVAGTIGIFALKSSRPLEVPSMQEAEAAQEIEPVDQELPFEFDDYFPDIPEEDVPVLAMPNQPLRWPLEGEILTGHHEVYRIGNQLRFHVGVDIDAKPDAVVVAAWPGIIRDVREDLRFGLVMEIEHGGGYISEYANLADAFFAVGDTVSAGAEIARVGSSALLDAQRGSFLHFALFKDGQALDPVKEISPK